MTSLTPDQKTHFLEVFPDLYDQVYRYLAYRIPHRPDAEDVVSQVFEDAWKHLDRFRAEQGTIEGWVTGIAKNRLRMYWRSHRLHVPLEDVEPFLIDPRGERLRDSVDDRLAVEALFEDLSSEQKALLAMRFEDDFSFEKIEEIAGVPAATLRKRVSRMLLHLRQTFTHYSS